MYHGKEIKRPTNPRAKANFFSIITFFFTFGLLKKGYKKELIEDDIYQILPKFKSAELGDQLEKEWLLEQKKNSKASVYRVLWKCYGFYYLMLGIVQLIVKITMVMIQPRALGKLVGFFTDSSKMSKTDAVYYAAVVIGLNILSCTYAHNYFFLITELGIRIKTAFCSLLYRKSLKLSSASLSDVSIGKIVTLISKDVTTFESAIIFLNDMWISVILLIITSILMYSRIGVAALWGVLFLILITPVQVCFGKLTSWLRLKASHETDHRLQVTQESLSAIKIIKMYTWEKFFRANIFKARKDEMAKIRQIYFTKATSLTIAGFVINITLYIIVMAYTSYGHIFTAEIAFFLVGCVQSLRSSVTASIPLGIAQSAEMAASIRRIRKVLTAKEQPQVPRKPYLKPSIALRGVTVEIGNKTILNDITLTIQSGLNIISGPLGGGKSSLLKTILDDYAIKTGTKQILGNVSYASEEPWLFASTIKQNILFGEDFDEGRYRTVLRVCALEQDINTFERGDATIVDDRGMNLSKGQQARISLARAMYRYCEIYLLDDCLSSLDTHVQEFVFKECILGFLKDKIVVMISNNEHLLKQADNVLLMENGMVTSSLKPSEIRDGEIAQLVAEETEKTDIIDNITLDSDSDAHEETQLIKDKHHDNIYREQKKEGKVDLAVYKEYNKFAGGVLVIILLIVLFAVAQFGASYSDKLFSRWINIQQNISEYKQNLTNVTIYENLISKNQNVLSIYTLTITVSTIFLLSRAFVHFSLAGRASVGLHKAMASTVINATMKFFDSNYLGNILNRFSKDLGTVDEILPLNVYECLRSFCGLAGIFVLIAGVNIMFLVPVFIIFVKLYFIRRYYIRTGRSLKRLDSATRSPMIGHINASMEGLVTIRSCGREEILRNEFDKHQDLYTSTFYMMQCASRAFAYTLDMLCTFFVAGVIIRFLIFDSDTSAGNVGLAISQALMLTGLLQWAIRQWAELESQITSVERVLEYTGVETEDRSGQELDNWPRIGTIKYENVSLTYGKSKELVLKNISFDINPQEKVGIVGRTGAGKSSLISTLFRLYQYDGTIKIDDVDVKTLTLDCLRSNIAIIPQDPVLFTGTMRSNIDPTSRYKDDDIWNALNHVNLKKVIPGLDYEIKDGGSTFSSGQRQLVCLARAIISKNKIIVLDEATANMDPETDATINATIRQNFKSCTIVTIAHRLASVLHMDKVMVIDKGELVEFDSPNELLADSESVFYKMVQQAKLLK